MPSFRVKPSVSLATNWEILSVLQSYPSSGVQPADNFRRRVQEYLEASGNVPSPDAVESFLRRIRSSGAPSPAPASSPQDSSANDIQGRPSDSGATALLSADGSLPFLSAVELLQLVNLRPSSAVMVHVCVADADSRLSDRAVDGIVALSGETLGVPSESFDPSDSRAPVGAPPGVAGALSSDTNRALSAKDAMAVDVVGDTQDGAREATAGVPDDEEDALAPVFGPGPTTDLVADGDDGESQASD
eukprot:TRINITY_DN24162_c0_g1_i1.p1 TRINITY_DN24162_c0_g1~~TRINITY_DN24162_c0_g1_i1.p1  ORF type:complete len:246 (+),score=30.76 TRINITY_DN24162_c0_g1_i1:83-820(+)